MTDKQILKKIIKKIGGVDGMIDDENATGYYLSRWHEDKFLKGELHSPNDYFPLIFSHSFAKAFWGEEEKKWKGRMGYDLDKGTSKKIKEIIKQGWQYHLQQMVLEKEPLKYLEKFL